MAPSTRPPAGAIPQRCWQGSRNHYSMRKIASGYGRWLGFLQRAGQLDPAEPPGQRATPERLDAYFAHLRACGNADYTVVARFDELRVALQWMHRACRSAGSPIPMARRSGHGCR